MSQIIKQMIISNKDDVRKCKMTTHHITFIFFFHGGQLHPHTSEIATCSFDGRLTFNQGKPINPYPTHTHKAAVCETSNGLPLPC